MKILILGGTGAMGAYLARILADAGMQVTVTSRRVHAGENNINYVVGNAHEEGFITSLIKSHYDVIIDFMCYTTERFKERKDLLLSSTGQYIFLSSGRVYADSQTPIRENSPRLIDVSKDKEFLSTDDYALAKARQENALYDSGMKNWTILRPYITYATERLQLGAFEKEQWLYRAMHKRTIVVQSDISRRVTTLTYGKDVAYVISRLIGNARALANTVQIAGRSAVTWDSVLQIYLSVLEQEWGKRPKVQYVDDPGLVRIIDNYQVKYDRLYNRIFESGKADEICGEKIVYTPPEEGLAICLREFLREKREFRTVYWRYQAYVDKLTGEHTKLKEISAAKEKRRYILRRYTPLFWHIG